MNTLKPKKKAHIDSSYCAACGVCVKQCPVHAIQIINGMYANVNTDKCVGCTKCAKVCPASIIHMKEVV